MIAVPIPVLAWGNSGHRAIADIAWTQLTPRAISSVNRLLALSPALGTPLCPVRNLEDAAVWADCVRNNYRDRFAHSATWHYVDVSVCRPFQLPPDPDSRFVVRRLETEILYLKDPAASPLRRLQALLWVAHLVGDIHQPLHVGDRYDRGGNELRVDRAGWRHATNLHAEWDRDLVESVIRQGEGGVAGLALEASDRQSAFGDKNKQNRLARAFGDDSSGFFPQLSL